MTRNLMAIAAATALLGMGGRVVTIGEPDDRWNVEREARRRRHVARVEARRQAHTNEQERKNDELNKLRAGIEPTTGHPLSRQRRRALQRQGFHFASVTLTEGGDAKQAPGASLSGAVGDSRDAQ